MNINNNFDGIIISDPHDYQIDDVINESFDMIINLLMVKKIDIYYSKKYATIKCAPNKKKLLQTIVNIEYILLDDFGHDYINISISVVDGNKNIMLTFFCGNNLDKEGIISFKINQEKQLLLKQYAFSLNGDIKITNTKIQLIIPIILHFIWVNSRHTAVSLGLNLVGPRPFGEPVYDGPALFRDTLVPPAREKPLEKVG